jgi:hypothetical protein
MLLQGPMDPRFLAADTAKLVSYADYKPILLSRIDQPSAIDKNLSGHASCPLPNGQG